MIATKKKTRRNVLLVLGLAAANLIFFLTIWMSSKYDDVSLDQFIYQAKTSAAGANRSIFNSAVVRVGVFGIAATVLEVGLYLLCTGHFQNRLSAKRLYETLRTKGICSLITNKVTPIVVSLLVVSLTFFSIKMDALAYVYTTNSDSDFIEENYVNPNKVTLTYPETKRNLIYIFLESMEVSYSDPAAGGPIYDNYIPELTALAEENVNFSNSDGVGGALTFDGTTWTAAAMVAQTSGVIVQVPLSADNYGGEDPYIPGLVTIGEVLEDAGYQQVLLLGSDAEFADRYSYFTEHGNYAIIDVNSLKEEGRLPEDYDEWWGYEDEKLFQFAKEELTKLASSGEPFNFTMLTADTHFPDGYVCQRCGDEYEEQYPNVLHCSSQQVYEFISWIQEQDFYENTTIVISGDHLTMDPDFMEGVDENYVRTIYNCIINSAVEPVQEKNRQFGTYDMFPTTLAAMGVEIEGDRLGLGTNLFSDRKTLTEEYGLEALNTELQKNSDFYNHVLLEMEGDK